LRCVVFDCGMSGWQVVRLQDRGLPLVSVGVRPGLGEPVLCLHGIQGRRQVFNALACSEKFNQHTLIALDFPGFGASVARRCRGDRLRGLAEVVWRATELLDVKRFHLVGHSLGGMVGTLMLAQSDSAILSFANLEGNLVPSDCGASAVVAGMSFGAFEQRGFAELLAGIEASVGADVEPRLEALKQTTVRTFYETASAIVEWSGSSELLRLFVDSRTPRCLIVGERNKDKTRVLPDDMTRHVIPDCGHFMLLENPTSTVEVLAAWIGSIE
jgi:pimeloyl-ACP methyl ester carboxylesterase